jgi:branched-chain amino acid transport system substrate-binding protein
MSRLRVRLARILIVPVLMLLVFIVSYATWWSAQGWVTKERISFGEKSLISEKPSLEKEDGMKAITNKNWSVAIKYLNESLSKKNNDPEARIFLNNAKTGSRYSYTIAVSVPISKNTKGSLEILRGVAQAQDEINSRGGINQVPLRVAIASDDNDKKVAQEVATGLASNPNILGVVGHYTSDVTIAAKDIYTSKKLVAITPISTSVCLTNTSINNTICPKNSNNSTNSKSYVFRTVPSDTDTARALANYMFQNLKTNNNVAIFYNSDSNYSKSLMSEFKTVVSRAKGQAYEIDMYQSSFDANLSLKQALEKNTQVLMLAVDTSTLPKALNVVMSAKKKFKILAGDDVYTPDTFDFRNEIIGMIVAAFWHIDNNSKSDFVLKSKQLWGESAKVNWRTALSYDATQALIAAIEKNPTRNGVQQALSSPQFKAIGASGYIEFLPSGERKNANTLVQLVEIVSTNNSDSPYEFIRVSSAPTATSQLTNTPTASSSTASLESDSVCRLQAGAYEAIVNSRQGLNLRAEPQENSKLLTPLKFNQKIIIFKQNVDKTWQNICVEGTKLKGWVKANNTQKFMK